MNPFDEMPESETNATPAEDNRVPGPGEPGGVDAHPQPSEEQAADIEAVSEVAETGPETAEAELAETATPEGEPDLWVELEQHVASAEQAYLSNADSGEEWAAQPVAEDAQPVAEDGEPVAEVAEVTGAVEQEPGEAVAEQDAAEVETAELEAAAPAYEENPLMNWFIIHTYSGFENKVSESLRTRAEAFGFAHRLGQILIPTEEVVEMRNGKKISSKRLLYPGYVLVQMEMDDDLWHQVKNTPRVTGFIGGGGKPVPLSATEVNSILFRQSTAAERPRPKLSFDKNETVRIVDGPFANFSGKVDEINPERNTLRVMVTIFGRSTPVELDFLQVEKIA